MKTLLTLFAFVLVNFSLLAQEIKSFQSSDKENLIYVETGSGPTIVLLYGGPGMSSDLMQPWADTLAGQFKSILFHQRGTGKSNNVKLDSTTINLNRAVMDIEDLRAHLNIEKLTLCGISWGGGLAQAYASFYPENVENLVLVSSMGPDLSFLSAFSDNIQSRMHYDDIDSLNYWNQQPDNALSESNRLYYVMQSYFYDQRLAESVLQNVSFGINSQMQGLMWQDLVKTFDLKSGLSNYKGKCQIIRPRQDIVPAAVPYLIKEILPQAKMIFIEKCGHFPDLECPEKFYSVLIKALK